MPEKDQRSPSPAVSSPSPAASSLKRHKEKRKAEGFTTVEVSMSPDVRHRYETLRTALGVSGRGASHRDMVTALLQIAEPALLNFVEQAKRDGQTDLSLHEVVKALRSKEVKRVWENTHRPPAKAAAPLLRSTFAGFEAVPAARTQSRIARRAS